MKVGLSLKKISIRGVYQSGFTEGDKHIDFKFSIYSNLRAGIAQSACKLGHGPDNQGIVSRFSAGASIMLFISSPECPV